VLCTVVDKNTDGVSSGRNGIEVWKKSCKSVQTFCVDSESQWLHYFGPSCSSRCHSWNTWWRHE